MTASAVDLSRSELMRRVRSRGTRPENAVAAALRSLGVSYRRNVKRLPGTPDFANQSAGWIIFVHGCFWHRHEGCPRTTTPKHNATFWADKFLNNVERDARKAQELKSRGLCVLTVWECQTTDAAGLREFLSELLKARCVECS